MQTAKTLIRLGGCPGWSESSLGAHSLCWFCHEAAQLWKLLLMIGCKAMLLISFLCTWMCAGALLAFSDMIDCSFDNVSGCLRHSLTCKSSDFYYDILPVSSASNGVAGSKPAGGEILPEPKRRFIAQSLSCSPFHRLEMTEILLKGRKTLTHPSIFSIECWH